MDSSNNSVISEKKTFSKRYIVAIMTFFGIANAYAMRSVLSMTIMLMAGNIHKNELNADSCPRPINTHNSTNTHADFNWSETLQGHILGAFYYGYVLAHVPSGILAQKYGAKQLFGIGICLTGVLTLLTPLAAKAGPGYMITIRILEGIGEAPTFPATNALMAQWVPANERSFMGSFVFAGNMMGTVIAQITSGYLLKFTGNNWTIVYYAFGIVALIWYATWLFTIYNTPDEHPTISNKELVYLKIHLKGVNKNKNSLKPTPWTAMLMSGPVWGLIFGQIAHDWALFMINSDLPKYMNSVLHFSIAETGVWSSLPHILMWLSALLTGWLSDYLILNGKIKILLQRKLFATIACIGPMLGTLAASYAGCDKVLVVILFAVGMATMGFFYPSMRVNILDLSPNYAGPAMALVNGIGAISGILSPPVIGYLIPNNSLLEWRKVFWISGIIVVLTNSVYVILASASLQWWNNPETTNNNV